MIWLIKKVTSDIWFTDQELTFKLCMSLSSKQPKETLTYSGSTKVMLEKSVKYVEHWRRSGVFTVNFEHISHFFSCFYS